MRNDGRIGSQILRVNYGSKSSVKVNYDWAASQMIQEEARKEWRNVAWNGMAKDRFSVNDLFVIAREVKFAFSNSGISTPFRHNFFALRQRLSFFYPPRKENEIHPLKNNHIKHSSSARIMISSISLRYIL